jgi:hypothetical protein
MPLQSQTAGAHRILANIYITIRKKLPVIARTNRTMILFSAIKDPGEHSENITKPN